MMRTATVWLSVLLAVPACMARADTLRVPHDWPTIQSAVDAASVGDTVLVACGIYAEHVEMRPGVTLYGDARSPDCVIIDGGGTDRCIRCQQTGPPAVIVGFTLQHGSSGYGGGMLVDGSSAEVSNCVFRDNVSGHGGGLLCAESSARIVGCLFEGNAAWESSVHGGGGASVHEATVEFDGCQFRENTARKGGGLVVKVRSHGTIHGCTFEGNSALFWGGAVHFAESTVEISDCTLVANSGGTGAGGIGVRDYATVSAANVIVALSAEGPSVSVDNLSSVLLGCCDLYGNAGGDWVGYVSNQFGVNGNIEADPLFCGDATPSAPYALHENSPCAPGGGSQCGLIGAWPVGCAPSPVRELSWGAIKAIAFTADGGSGVQPPRPHEIPPPRLKRGC
jgi:hypothetical protein